MPSPPRWTSTLRAAALLLWCIVSTQRSWAACPSACNGHGICTPSNTCSCFLGYTGYDCFARECPSAAPWVDYSTADDTMRAVLRECSNMGRCSRDSGRCECEPGFSGNACERMVGPCNGKCSGHGRCLSLRDVGPMQNDYNLFSSATYTTPWDATRVYGCVCDYGYTGTDCSKRLCPHGDDPITTGQADEVQALSCKCVGCTGTFTLRFRGETTRPLNPLTETNVTLKEALEALLTIRSVTITVTSGASVSPMCSSSGVSALITFTHEHGDVPNLVIDSSLITGGTSSITLETGGTTATYGGATATGTKEWTPCSGRGLCNTNSGACSCDAGFESSDALGGQGRIADCGYRSGGAMTSCPINYGSACSGHGRCSGTPDYKCSCDYEYSGHDCSARQCAQGRAWWAEPQATDEAHLNPVECSNAGYCDPVGICRCYTGFEGVACDRLSCPTTGDGICNGRGRCRSARELAALTPTATYGTAGFVYGKDPNALATWDANMIYGCHCDKLHRKRGQSIRYTGHNCGKVPCPQGDDPWTANQVDEIQNIQCSADGGSFTLTFRGETTAAIAYSASAGAVKAALEKLRTIVLVSVSFTDTTACTAAGNSILIKFHSPSGDLPLLSIDASALTLASAAATPTVAQTVQGTKEDAVCNNRGRCDEDSGICLCALHHASSDAKGGYGAMYDCGVVDKFMTHGEL